MRPLQNFKVESSQWQQPMDSLHDFILLRYGTKEIASVALYYVLKALHKYINKPRVQLFCDILSRKRAECLFLHVETLVNIASKAIPKHLNWSIKLEEQLLKCLYGKPFANDANRIALLRGEFGMFCVHELGSKYDQNPGREVMKDVFLDFIASLSLNTKDPFHDKWAEHFEQVKYRSKKAMTSVNTVVSEVVANIAVPSSLIHADRILARKHMHSMERHKLLYDAHVAAFSDLGEDESVIPMLKEIGVPELAAIAASFEVVHCV